MCLFLLRVYVKKERASIIYLNRGYTPRPNAKLVKMLYKHAVELKGKRRIKVVRDGV